MIRTILRPFGITVRAMLLTVLIVSGTAYWIQSLLHTAARQTIAAYEDRDLDRDTVAFGREILDRSSSFRGEVGRLSLWLEKDLGAPSESFHKEDVLKILDQHAKRPEFDRIAAHLLRLELWPIRKKEAYEFPASDENKIDLLDKPAEIDGDAAAQAAQESELEKFKTEASQKWSADNHLFQQPIVLSPIMHTPMTAISRRLTRFSNGLSRVQYVLWLARLIPKMANPQSNAEEDSWVLVAAIPMDDIFHRYADSPRHLIAVRQVIKEGKASTVKPLIRPVGSLAGQADGKDYSASCDSVFAAFPEPQGAGGPFRDSTSAHAKPAKATLEAAQFYFTECQSGLPGLSDEEQAAAESCIRELGARQAADSWDGADQYFLRIGGADKVSPNIRLLASSEAALADGKQKVTDALQARFKGNKSVLDKIAGISWNPTGTTRNCDVRYSSIQYDATNEARAVQIGRAQFVEAQEADLHSEFSHGAAVYPVLAVALVLALAFSLYATLPLRRIARIAAAVAQSGGGQSFGAEVAEQVEKLPVNRHDEVGDLAQAFQTMFREVRSRQEALLKLNAELEDRVRRRTESLEAKNQELNDLLEGRKRFISAISHDLKTPLTTIKGYCDLLLESPLTDEQRDDLRTMQSAGNRLLSLIEDILDSHKLEVRELKLDLQEFRIADLLEDIRKALLPLATKTGNALVVDCQRADSPSDLGVMVSDREKVARVLTNLINNACKFTKKGRITLRAEKCPHSDGGAGIALSVADTGRGIAEEHRAKIFKPFPKILNKADNPEGTGLGLSNCKGYCEALGGTIDFSSEVNRGTVFTARLPLRPKDYNAGRASWSGLTGPRTSTGSSGVFVRNADGSGIFPPRSTNQILVIEDDAEVREMLKRYMEKQGYSVIVAADAQDGLAKAIGVRPALITLDALMPGRDGWAVLQDLKANPRTCEIPVVMISIVDDRYKGFALGASDYIAKPIDWDRLGRVLARFRGGPAADSVLIIDDDPEIRTLAQRHLGIHGWSVIGAGNGREGLDCLAAQKPSVILLDLDMPVMNGFEFLDELRSKENRVPVLVLTAMDLTPADRERVLLGAAQVIPKSSLDWPSLEAEVERAMSQHVVSQHVVSQHVSGQKEASGASP